MKALANGGLNLSILDGWWDEAWQTPAAEKRFIGWAIGNGESYDNPDYQDQVESAALYDLLERDIVPDVLRPRRRRPAAPLDRPDEELHFHAVPDFNMQRMVKEYATDFYVTANDEIPAAYGERGGTGQGTGGVDCPYSGSLERSSRRIGGFLDARGPSGGQPSPGASANSPRRIDPRIRSPWNSTWEGSTPMAS